MMMDHDDGSRWIMMMLGDDCVWWWLLMMDDDYDDVWLWINSSECDRKGDPYSSI